MCVCVFGGFAGDLWGRIFEFCRALPVKVSKGTRSGFLCTLRSRTVKGSVGVCGGLGGGSNFRVLQGAPCESQQSGLAASVVSHRKYFR